MVTQGVRLDLHSKNRIGLVSDITRVFRENGLSISRIEVATQGDKAYGSFYVTDASGLNASPTTVELVTREIGESIIAVHKSPSRVPHDHGSSSRTAPKTNSARVQQQQQQQREEDRPRFSIGSLLWSQLGRFSSNFGPVRS